MLIIFIYSKLSVSGDWLLINIINCLNIYIEDFSEYLYKCAAPRFAGIAKAVNKKILKPHLEEFFDIIFYSLGITCLDFFINLRPTSKNFSWVV